MEQVPQPQFIQINENVRMSVSCTKYAEAMALVQAELGSAVESAKNPHFNSSYADLPTVINTAKPVLAKHGFSIQQLPCGVPPIAKVTTIIRHKSGEWLAFDLSLRPAKDDPQGHGGAITYARRYSLEACLNMPTKDDDGNVATGLGAPPASNAPQSYAPSPTATAKPTVKPVSNPNDAYPIDHVMTFKKFRGMNVNQTPKHEIDGYLKWLIDASKKPNGIPVPQEALMLMDKIDEITSQNFKTGGARQSDGPPPGMFEDIPF